MQERRLTTALGPVTIEIHDGAIIALRWRPGRRDTCDLPASAEDQSGGYFGETRKDFDLPLVPGGTDLTRRVCALLQAVPFGETRTYGDLARDLGAPAQTTGQACSANPMPVLIPCPRTLGANGPGGFCPWRDGNQGLAVAP